MHEQNGTRFDVIVLGGGPGGYPAAIKAAQMGRKVALIEAKEVGGTCLNRGCIPSKTLIANATLLQKIQRAEEFGICVGPISFDFSQMAKRKDAVVSHVREGLEGLLRANGVTLIRGWGKLRSPHEVTVRAVETTQQNLVLHGDKIILATGSEPRNIPAFPCDQRKILDSTAMLSIEKLPRSLAIIGGGVIGCEFASLYHAFGVHVTLIELLPSLLPMECPSVSQALTNAFTRKGIEIFTNTRVQGVHEEGEKTSVYIEQRKRIEVDMVLVAIGRSLNTSGIGLEKLGISIDRKTGLIAVDEHMETTVPGIYAVGDIASKWWLAHVASHQGVVAARHACGEHNSMHYDAIPSVIFTEPEIATVGLSLEASLKKGYHATVSAFPFYASGKAQASLATEGFAQIIVEKGTGQILGAQVVGEDAATLVAEMGIAIANELTVECISDTIHAHPTIAEAWMEAALAANNTPLHLPPKSRKAEPQ